MNDIDKYIASFPKDIQKLLKQIRTTIKKAAPEAGETIKYGMPVFTFNGNLVYFAGCKNHIGFYPGASATATFRDELGDLGGAKGTVRFPFDDPLPLVLIGKIVEFRVNENLKKAKAKKESRKPLK